MKVLKNIFWIFLLVIVLIVGYQLVPIYYRAFSLDGICQENADLFHRYNKRYIKQKLKEDLDKIGIPRNQRETALTKTKETIVVEIYYEDTADFLGYYKKDFAFFKECNGVLSSIVSQ